MKIFFAGIEGGFTKDLLAVRRFTNVFMSYYLLRTKKDNAIPKIVRENVTGLIVIDSGAHSFFSESGLHMSASVVQKKHKTKETPDEYWHNYKGWILANFDLFDYFVELDIGELVGQDKILKWREELKEMGVFGKCITVYHPAVVSDDDFMAMIKESESRYIGFEGFRPGKKHIDYNKYLKICYENKVKSHGFAMTKEQVYGDYPFFSVDSTSWKAGSLWGTTRLELKNGKHKNVSFRNKKALMGVKDLDLAALSSHNKTACVSRDSQSVGSYLQTELFYTRLWQKRNIDFSCF